MSSGGLGKTTEEWIELARENCTSALSEPAIRKVAEVLASANISESMQREALRTTSLAQSPSPGLLKLQQLVGEKDAVLNRFPLERKLLLDQALIALPQIRNLPVDDTVQQLFCKEFILMAEPTEEALPRFASNGYVFAAMGKLGLFQRFPAGHYHWEISGFPRGWIPKVPLRLMPSTLRFLFSQAGGLSPWFMSHMRGTGPGTPFLIESEFQKSFYRMALALKLQPHIRALCAESWLHSPETHRISPHLAFLNRIFLEAGGTVTDLGPAGPDDGFAHGHKQRAELYKKGEYKPTVGVAMCSRAQAISWADARPQLGNAILVK